MALDYELADEMTDPDDGPRQASPEDRIWPDVATFAMVACILLAIALTPTAVASQEPGFPSIAAECLPTELRNCRVLGAGFLNEDDEGEAFIAWQLQAGFTPELGSLGGFVLYWNGPDGWTELDAAFDGWRFAQPQMNDAGLLHIAGYTGGTGAYNADRLYQWSPAREDQEAGWQRIDVDSWLTDIGEMLPAGLEIWKGVRYELVDPWHGGMLARTSLWRRDDANCCPTGGDAIIEFEIGDDRLVATDVIYMAPPTP